MTQENKTGCRKRVSNQVSPRGNLRLSFLQEIGLNLQPKEELLTMFNTFLKCVCNAHKKH